MFKYRITTLVVALVIAAPTVADDGDRSITVNCDEGSTVGQVLAEKARKGDPLVLRSGWRAAAPRDEEAV